MGPPPNIQLCLHLCLTEGQPIAAPQQIPDLMDSKGRLKYSFAALTLASYLPKKSSKRQRLEKQLRFELNAQM